MRILVAQLNPTVGDFSGNLAKVLHAIEEGKKIQVDLVLTSELVLTGYPPDDFLLLSHFVKAAEDTLQKLLPATQGIGAIIGTIRQNEARLEKPLFNTAAILYDGKLIGFQDKTLLPTYDVFYERRYFEPAHGITPWRIGPYTLGVTICEDLWQHSGEVKFTTYACDPVKELNQYPLDALVNLSSSPFHVGKVSRRIRVVEKPAKTLQCPVILCNQVGGNDSLIFDGYSLAANADGKLTHIAKGFEEDFLIIDTKDHAPPLSFKENTTTDLYHALVMGLHDYFYKSGFKKACLGLSGGIDSALVACIASAALGPQNVLGVALPSRYSPSSSLEDAQKLAKTLGIQFRVIPIEEPFKSYLELLNPYFENKPPDATEENIQARIRGMILMALSNKLGYIVLSTGNKSELAMGYATLYGDMCGGLGVINDLTKEQVYQLAHWINREQEIIPQSTLIKPPSAELRPDQKDTDTLPEYPIVDKVLKDYIEAGKSPEEISKGHALPLTLVEDLIKRIHNNEYKRRQSPPGLRISEKAFSVGRRFPIVQKWV